MSKYNIKEKKIIKQCKEGPYHTLITNITNDEFNNLVDKLIKDDESSILTSIIAIYIDYNRDKITNYFINKKDVNLLIGYLDYCNDFESPNNILNQRYIVDKLIDLNDKEYIKNIIDSNLLYYLTNIKEKERLNNYIGGK